MIKKRLEKAPLVFSQAQFHFTDLPSPQLGSEQELESLHKAMMDIGLADRINSEVIEMGFHFNQNNSNDGYFQVKQEKNSRDRLIFRGFGSHRAAELTHNRLIIKTTEYTTYEDFRDFVSSILDAVHNNIKDLGKVLMKQISLRYVDIVLPSEQYELKDYIHPAFLPFHPDFASQTIGVSQSLASTGDNRAMVLLMEELEPLPSGFPGRWLPVDLMEPDPHASLLLNPVIDGYDSKKNYGILSIDHQVDLPDTPKWSIHDSLNNLDNLYDLSSRAFWGAITDTAEEEWGVISV